MQNNRSSLIWGIALIAGGLLFLASNYGILPDWNNNPNFWIPALLVLSALFLLTFALQGRRAWGWLFPACICAGQAATIYLAVNLVNSPLIAFPVMISAAIPFVIGYLLDTSRKGLLIPAWIIAAVAGMMFFVDNVKGEVIPLYIMLATALPFLFVGLTDPRKRALLIPGGIIALVGAFPIAVSSMKNEYVPTLIMSLIALPFAVTALWSRKNWWAIIPAGVMLSIGAALLLSGATGSDMPFSSPNGEQQAAMLVGLMFSGWALTFGLLWLLRGSAPTAWAIWPAGALLLVAAGSFAFGAESANIIWPVIIIAGGVLLLFRNFRPRPQ